MAIVVAGVLVLCAVALLSSRAASLEKQHQAAARASAELKAHVSLAHLWFEEAVTGDPDVDLVADVYANLDRSVRLCRAMRDGGLTRAGMVMAMGGDEGQANLTTLCRRLVRFREATAERWRNRSASAPGSAEEEAYDALFHEILHRSDRDSVFMERLMDEDRRFQRRLDTSVGVGRTALFGGIVAVGRRHRAWWRPRTPSSRVWRRS